MIPKKLGPDLIRAGHRFSENIMLQGTRMQRIAGPERSDWRDLAAQVGFDFHTIDGAPYWDETAH
ncbi:MAG: hypothetical protein ACJ8ES_10600, partial [Xanthobacteraceae bacterium]